MNENFIKNILKDLYELDPSLKNKEGALIKIINKLIEARPEIKIDENFLSELKKEVDLKLGQKSFLNNMKKEKKSFVSWPSFSYGLSVSALVLILAIIVLPQAKKVSVEMGNNLGKENKNVAKEGKSVAIKKVEANAFGKIVSQPNSSNASSGSEIARVSSDQAVAGIGGGGASLSAKSSFMPPFYNIKYVYKGEEFDLSNISKQVYRRIYEDVSDNAEGVVSNLNVSFLDMSSLRDLKIDNINIKEDREFGYFFNFSPYQGYFSLGKNWEKWPDPYTACSGNETCYEDLRLKEGDVLSDEDLVAIAKNFLSEYGLNLENYGNPEVDSSWKNYRPAEGQPIYVPEEISIIYPLKIEGREVHYDGGTKMGLNVSVDLRNKKVSSVSANFNFKYESSEYEMETDFERIKSLAEKGGSAYPSFYSEEGGETKEVVLGTPFESLVLSWIYDEDTKKSEEIYVPAMVFPVIEKPSEGFWNNSIIIPLSKEILKEREANSNNGGIEPRLLLESAIK